MSLHHIIARNSFFLCQYVNSKSGFVMFFKGFGSSICSVLVLLKKKGKSSAEAYSVVV